MSSDEIFPPTFTDIINLCGEKEGTLPISTIPFRLLTKFQQQELYSLKNVNEHFLTVKL